MALRIRRSRLPISAPSGVGIVAMRRWAHRTHLAGCLALLAACRAGGGGGGKERSTAAGSLRVTDDAGRVLVLAAPPRRIVALSPATSELLFALGAGDRLVGRTTWCDYPPDVRAVPSVGDGLDPNLEAIVARHPDLVVLYPSPLDEAAARRLGELGIPAALLRQDRLEELAHAARWLGAVTGHERAGDSLAQVLTDVLKARAGDAEVRLAFVVWDNPPTVIGGASYLDELAAHAGARNVFHDLDAPSAVVSLETIAARDPDVLAVLGDSTSPPPDLARRREWRTLRAVRERHVITLAGSLFDRPTPRAAAAVAELRRLLEAAR